jgi:hypothetical protein
VRSLGRREFLFTVSNGEQNQCPAGDAIHRLAAAEPETRQGQMAFDMWKDAIGCAEGGPPDLSERTGRHFCSLLLAKRRA